MSAPPSRGDMPASIFVADSQEVHNVPMRVIRRPLASALEEQKVQEFMQKIKSGEQMTPIEVAMVERPEGNFYFSFGGCHRWEAYQRLGAQTIPAKLVRTPASSINVYLGSSSPFV